MISPTVYQQRRDSSCRKLLPLRGTLGGSHGGDGGFQGGAFERLWEGTRRGEWRIGGTYWVGWEGLNGESGRECRGGVTEGLWEEWIADGGEHLRD